MTNLPGALPYILTITDDFSGYVWAYGMTAKSEAGKILRRWHAMVQNHYPQFSLATFRPDNGREFISSELSEYWQERGVKHETSIPHTPQQNGVAERMNRTISDKVTCICIRLA